MVKYSLFFTFLLLFGFPQAQISFYKKYAGSGYDIAQGIAQMADSSYVITGRSTSFFNGPPQAFIMKIDSLGNHVWAKHFGDAETESGKRIFVTENDGFYVAGHTNSTSNGDFDFYFLHTDLTGDLIWEKKYGTQSWDLFNDAIKLSDSTYVLVGESFNPIDGKTDGYIMRLNKLGDTLWTKKTNYLGEDTFLDVENYFDTAFVVAGKTWNADSSLLKAYMACYKTDGTLLWENEYGPHGNYELKSIAKINDYILAVGTRIDPVDGLKDDYNLRITGQGNTIFSFSYNSQGDRSHDFILKYGSSNRFYVVAANDDQFTTGEGQDLYIASYDDFMFSQNSWVDVDGSFDDLIGEMIVTSDNGAIAVGSNHNFKIGIPSVFVLKIGANENFPSTTGVLTATNLVSLQENVPDQMTTILYPNPNNGDFQIELVGNHSNGKVWLTSLDGKLVFQQEVESGIIHVNASAIESGVYLVSYQTKGGEASVIGKVQIR